MKPSASLIFALIASLGVAVAITAGLMVSGSPSVARAQRFDDQRVRDLRDLVNAIDRYHPKGGSVPDTLSALSPSSARLPQTDPETGAPYEYHRLDANRYEVCADFAMAGETSLDPRSVPWKHDRGHTCFRFICELQLDGRNSKSKSVL